MNRTFWLRWTSPTRFIRYSSGSIPAAKTLADHVLAAQIGRLHPSLMLLQNPDDLLFRKPRTLHRPHPFLGLRTLLAFSGGFGAQVSRWKRLSENQKINAVIKLKTATVQQVLIAREQLERLALEPRVDYA